MTAEGSLPQVPILSINTHPEYVLLIAFLLNSCYTNSHQFYFTVHCLSWFILEELVHKLSARFWRVKDESSFSYSRSATKRWAPLLTWKSDSDTCRKLVGRFTQFVILQIIVSSHDDWRLMLCDWPTSPFTALGSISFPATAQKARCLEIVWHLFILVPSGYGNVKIQGCEGTGLWRHAVKLWVRIFTKFEASS